MHTSPIIRKVFEGVATSQEMCRMFNRHRGNPAMAEGEARHLFAGEWFEIAESEHDYMLDILPPLWMRGDMFAMREFVTDSVTSVFLSLWIDGAQALLPRILRPLRSQRPGEHEAGNHRTRVASGPRHDSRRTPRAHLVEHSR